VSIADAGHYPWVEQPHAFTTALGDFYAEIDSYEANRALPA
jgi:pimeloyl-ACP methyl ester carboxylesterase